MAPMGPVRVPRRRRLGRLLALSTLLGWALACSSDITGPETAFCARRGPAAIPTFEDANLESKIREVLSLRPTDDLTCEFVAAVTDLSAPGAQIRSLAGIENLTRLTTLRIRANSITDIRPLRDLTSLTHLNLAANSISDIDPLGGLTELTFLAINDNGSIVDIGALRGLSKLTGTLWIAGNSITELDALSELTALSNINAWDNQITDLSGLEGLTGLQAVRLHFNAITDLAPLADLPALQLVWLHNNPDLRDIQPLIDNPGLPGGSVNLADTGVSCTDVNALEARQVSVTSDCT